MKYLRAKKIRATPAMRAAPPPRPMLRPRMSGSLELSSFFLVGDGDGEWEEPWLGVGLAECWLGEAEGDAELGEAEGVGVAECALGEAEGVGLAECLLGEGEADTALAEGVGLAE